MYKSPQVFINLSFPVKFLALRFLTHGSCGGLLVGCLRARGCSWRRRRRACQVGTLPSDDFRNQRFKLIPRIVDGPWVVKASIPQKPALLGQKLTQRYRARNFTHPLHIPRDSLLFLVAEKKEKKKTQGYPLCVHLCASRRKILRLFIYPIILAGISGASATWRQTCTWALPSWRTT